MTFGRLGFVLAALMVPHAVIAERIEAGFEIEQVTLYPFQALVERAVTFDATAGAHEVVIGGFPPGLRAGGLWVAPPEGVTVLSSRLARGRLPVTERVVAPQVLAAEAEVDGRRSALEQAQSAVAAILVREAAAAEQLAFLRGLGAGAADGPLSPERLDEIRALAAVVGDLALAAETQAHVARVEAQAAQAAVDAAQAQLDQAQQALDAVYLARDETVTLILEVEVAEAAEFTIEILSETREAYWRPIYDLFLDTDTGHLQMIRHVVMGQSSGEDWMNVALRLSTSQGAGQVGPGPVWGRQSEIVSEAQLEREAAIARGGEGGYATAIVEPPVVVVTPSAPPTADFQGMTIVYDYPNVVDLRDGSDELRLALGEVSFEAALSAQAVPSRDDAAYLVARFENDTGAVLLPGQALLVRDGALVGEIEIDMVLAGAEAQVGFGPIDGLRLDRRVISQSEGEVGIVTSSNSREQRVVLEIENLTRRAWDVVLRDGFGFSQQDDLVITVEADPAITRVAPGDRRGVVEWDLTLEAGALVQVDVVETTTWPSGYELR